MSGSTYTTQGGWMNLAPGVTLNGATPAAPPATYDQWGRPQGGTAAAAAPAPAMPLTSAWGSGWSAPAAVAAPTSQTAPAGSGYGASGYDQWGRQSPAALAAGAQQPASLLDQSAWLGPMQSGWLASQGAPDADVLRAATNIPGLSGQGLANLYQAIQQAGGRAGGGQIPMGLLGAALAGGGVGGGAGSTASGNSGDLAQDAANAQGDKTSLGGIY